MTVSTLIDPPGCVSDTERSNHADAAEMYWGYPYSIWGLSPDALFELASLPLSLPRVANIFVLVNHGDLHHLGCFVRRFLHYFQAFPVPSNLLERGQLSLPSRASRESAGLPPVKWFEFGTDGFQETTRLCMGEFFFCDWVNLHGLRDFANGFAYLGTARPKLLASKTP